ncbi:UNVERIFIED_CONTAM: Xpo1 [Trichonephila clavipes]
MVFLSGLQILEQLLHNIENDKARAQSFYQTYYTDILQHLFSVVTDTSHSAGLSMQATILAYMFNLVESGKITVPLNPVEQASGQNNIIYTQEFVAHLLKTAFAHLSDAQIKITVQGFFNLDENIHAFKEHLRDFLVQIREFAGEDDSDLFLEEREAALLEAQAEKRRIDKSVPGILNPHEIAEEMQD